MPKYQRGRSQHTRQCVYKAALRSCLEMCSREPPELEGRLTVYMGGSWVCVESNANSCLSSQNLSVVQYG